MSGPPRYHSKPGALIQVEADLFLSLNPEVVKGDDVWIDFVADIGDSWDATYATLSLIARNTLTVRGLPSALPRGDILAIGGDLVYPSPSRNTYRTKTRTAFRAALPEQPQLRQPSVVAIPGNHDWYDGLTGFLREFCQGGLLGGWTLEQRRSYFAVKLKRDWWLLGIDIALDSRIDAPQQSYFTEILLSIPRPPIGPRARVILCAPKPVWLANPRYSRDADKNLGFFLDLLRAHGCEVKLILSGDTHHYSRYQARKSGRQLIVAGGGGAYLSATHRIPPSVADLTDAPPPGGPETFDATEYPYPTVLQSRRLLWGALGLAFHSRNWPFAVVAGAIYAVMTLPLYKPWWLVMTGTVNGFHARLLTALQTEVPWYSGALALAVLAGTALFTMAANRGPGLLKGLWGLTHGVAHGAVALWLLSWYRYLEPAAKLQEAAPAIFSVQILGESVGHLLAILAYVVVGGALATTLLGAFVAVSDVMFGWHTNEAFSFQSIFDFRNFVRMHLDASGTLTVYPVGLGRVPRRWRARAVHVDEALAPRNVASPADERHPAAYESGDAILDPHAIEPEIIIR